MYEYLKKYVESNIDERNLFFKVTEEEIKQAEERMKFKFPNSIKIFYEEIGYGFLGKNANYINRIMAPDDIADYVCGNDIYEYVDKSIYNEDELVFMHIADEDFLTIKYSGESEGEVLYFGEKIADSFEEFINKMFNKPNYYI